MATGNSLPTPPGAPFPTEMLTDGAPGVKERSSVVGRCRRLPGSGGGAQIRIQSQHLLRRRDGAAGGLAGGDVGQVIPQPQPQEAVAHELAGGEATALFLGQLPRLDHQLESYLLRLGVAVGDALGQDVPDRHQDLAGDGDDGHVGGLAPGEALELLLPVGRLLHRHPSGLDKDAAQVAASLFGDALPPMGLAAVVDTGARSGVAHRVLGRRETGDVADGRQDGHSRQQAEAGELDEEGDQVLPGLLIAEAAQFLLHLTHLLLDVGQRVEGLVQAQPLAGGEVELSPPFPVVGGEGVTGRGVDVVAIEGAMELVLEAGLLLDQLVAMGDEGAKFAHRFGGYPDLRDEIGGQEPGRSQGVVGVGLDNSGSDPFDLQGIGDHTATDQGGQQVVDEPGVARRLQHEGILGAQVAFGPLGQVVQRDAPGLEEHLLAGIHSGHDHVILVEVEADETGRGGSKFGSHRTPPGRERMKRKGWARIWGTDLQLPIRARGPR